MELPLKLHVEADEPGRKSDCLLGARLDDDRGREHREHVHPLQNQKNRQLTRSLQPS